MTLGWPKPRALPTLSPDREDRRAEERARRAGERVAAAEQRSEARATDRDAAAHSREQAREARRREEIARATTRAPVEKPDSYVKRRASGAVARTGTEAKTDRDTRGYATVVDPARIRALADKGISLAGLAATFGITVAEVEAALREE